MSNTNNCLRNRLDIDLCSLYNTFSTHARCAACSLCAAQALGYLLVVHFAKGGWRSWRILTNAILIPTIPLLSTIFLMPESPCYLMKHSRYRQALESFLQLRVTQLLASRDFILTHAQLDLEGRILSEMSGVAKPSEWSKHSSNTVLSSGPIS